ncbi:hypothetical protein DL96DRAFT_299577 [Flagelloscypha sp. PMI_526]|nr:hypothetical protein DL96DRAFT_299577 [Flagelloscypha sp. PMI_526]
MPAQRTKDTLLGIAPEASAPALSILAPTPRAFTFPPAHNLSDSPYSSPSNSPFEPEFPPSLQSIPQSSSPDSTTIPTPPPTTTRHRRRTSSSDAERRPKKGDEDYIKRPENAFILFRRKCVDDREAAALEAGEPLKKIRQADLSKMISQQWKGLSPEDRQYWENLAKEKKREHEQLHPDYVYRPTRTKKSTTRAARRRAAQAAMRDGQLPLSAKDSMSFILPVPQQPSPRQHGRSASAPTPPPYQSFNIPNVFAGTPGSCPTSPSLMPLIAARRGAPTDIFDYVPPHQASYTPMTYESTDLLRSMYNQHQQIPPPLSLPSSSTDLCSPASSTASTSSGPSSPDAVPFTPTSALISQPYMQSQYDAVTCEAMSQADLHEQQLQLQQQDWDLAGYAWDANSIWGPSDLLIAEDFDINSIPPIELGVPNKILDQQMIMGGQPGFFEQSREHFPEQSSPLGGGLVGFDEMVSGDRTF